MEVKFSSFYSYLEIDNIKEIIIDKISILDILDRYKIDYVKSMSGNFTEKCICPMKIHKNGEEATPSFYISSETNSFYCFGCLSSGNVIKFVSQYEGCPHEIAITKLCKILGITKETNIDDIKIVKKEKNDFRFKVEDSVFNSGIMIRDFIKKIEDSVVHSRAVKWAEKQFKDLDEILNEIECNREVKEDVVLKANNKYEKIKENINKLNIKYKI